MNMSFRAALAYSLVTALVVSTIPIAAQNNGLIAGKAENEAKAPYSDYRIDIRDTASLMVVGTGPLDPKAKFSISSLPLSKKYQVELVQIMDKGKQIQPKIICTEGPYEMTTTKFSFTDVDINCGTNPAAWWLAAAGGAAAAIALGVRSPSR
jgi:hypothetical protein